MTHMMAPTRIVNICSPMIEKGFMKPRLSAGVWDDSTYESGHGGPVVDADAIAEEFARVQAQCDYSCCEGQDRGHDADNVAASACARLGGRRRVVRHGAGVGGQAGCRNHQISSVTGRVLHVGVPLARARRGRERDRRKWFMCSSTVLLVSRWASSAQVHSSLVGR